jgi:arylsulfatase A-like enzyme
VLVLFGLQIGLGVAAVHYSTSHDVHASAMRVLLGIAAGILLGTIAAWPRAAHVVHRIFPVLLTLPILAPAIVWRLLGDDLRAIPTAPWVIAAAVVLPFSAVVGARLSRRLALVLVGLCTVGALVLALGFGVHKGVVATLLGHHVPIRAAVQIGTRISDVDGDGASSLFGGGDCAPLDPHVAPGRAEVAGNGIDENCILGDLADDAERVASGSTAPSPTWDARPNVVLIAVDALRADHMSVYGYERDTTPRIAQYLADAFRFTHAHAESATTRTTIPSLLAGRRWPEIHWHEHQATVLDPRNDFLPELLGRHGYRTVGVIPFTAVNMIGNPELGFDVLVAYDDGHSRRRTGHAVNGGLRRAIEGYDGPFFAYLHFYEPHHPYVAYQDFAAVSPLPYDHEVAAVDQYIGTLMEELESKGVLERTVVIVTGDHGEAFGEHGEHFHGWGAYEVDLAVPLLVLVPGRVGHVIEEPVSITALPDTLLDLVGLSRGPDFAPTVGSLWPLMAGSDADAEAEIVSGVSPADLDRPERLALIAGDHKIIFDRMMRWIEVYDLREDPREDDNLLEREPELVARLEKLAESFLEHVVGAAQSRWRRKLEHDRLPEGVEPASVPAAPGLELAGATAVLVGEVGAYRELPMRVLVRTFFLRTADEPSPPRYRVALERAGEVSQEIDGLLLDSAYHPRDWPAGSYLEDVRTFKVYVTDVDDEVVVTVAGERIDIGPVRTLPVWKHTREP